MKKIPPLDHLVGESENMNLIRFIYMVIMVVGKLNFLKFLVGEKYTFIQKKNIHRLKVSGFSNLIQKGNFIQVICWGRN